MGAGVPSGLQNRFEELGASWVGSIPTYPRQISPVVSSYGTTHQTGRSNHCPEPQCRNKASGTHAERPVAISLSRFWDIGHAHEREGEMGELASGCGRRPHRAREREAEITGEGMHKKLIQNLPKVDDILRNTGLEKLSSTLPRNILRDAIRCAIEEKRALILSGGAAHRMVDADDANAHAPVFGSELIVDAGDTNAHAPVLESELIVDAGDANAHVPVLEPELKMPAIDVSAESIIARVHCLLEALYAPSLRPVINATGVALHTNLGRACLHERAGAAALNAAQHYSTLEYDLETGKRGSRNDHIEDLICRTTGAEAALVVNNNAAATFLCLAALARGREVVVSRGELVEIGGSFRIPDIMRESGALLREVGTTNKTRIADYAGAIGEATALMLKVHTSNYRILGFTEAVSLETLVGLGRDRGLPVIYDIGSGLMVNLEEYNVFEPTVPESLKTGVDLILFSGDKLFGGPQGGIIAGKREYVDQLKSHPLARALRVDKMTMAAMESTLKSYLDLNTAKREIPVLHMITQDADSLKVRAKGLIRALKKSCPSFIADLEPTENRIGGGAAPDAVLSGYAVRLAAKGKSAQELGTMLEKLPVPIVARIKEAHVYLEMRTVTENEAETIAMQLQKMEQNG